MVLMTSSYRYESMLCRNLKKESEGRDPELLQRAAHGVRVAIYELDAIIGRAMAYDMLQMLPMALYVFQTNPVFRFQTNKIRNPSISIVPTVLALHLELVLSSSESDAVKSRSRIYIHQAIVFLQQCRDFPFMKIALELVDWALTKQNLLSADRQNAPVINGNYLHQQELPGGRDTEADDAVRENQTMVDLSVFDVLERLDEFLELGAMDDTLISDLWQM